jgi:hypothetical protein
LEVLDKGSLIREEILNERQYFPEDRGIKKEKWRPPQVIPGEGTCELSELRM